MRPIGFSTVCSRLVVSALFVALVLHATAVRGEQPAPDPCAWLTTAQLNKTLGQRFAAPEQSVAPAAYAGQPSGTKCGYKSEQGGAVEVTFIVYVDPSPAQAKATFEKLSTFFPATSKPGGIGDAAYVDEGYAIHVLKGNVRYYISVSTSDATPESQKQLRDLATGVAAQI